MLLDLLLDIPFMRTPPDKLTEEKTSEKSQVSVMRLSVLMGELLLKNGAEIYRVQDTLNRVIDACGYPNHSVYTISNGVFITINEGEEDACSSLRHVPLGSVNLERIAVLNQISRDLCDGRITRKQAYLRLRSVASSNRENRKSMILASGFGAAGFCVLFGGSLLDGAASFIIGMGLQIFLYYMTYHRVSRFPANIIAAFYITLASVLCCLTPLPFSFGNIVIGAVIDLVPGYSFTTAIRDLFNSDYLSGLIHALDAIVLAVCIAVGVGMGISFITFLGGGALV